VGGGCAIRKAALAVALTGLGCADAPKERSLVPDSGAPAPVVNVDSGSAPGTGGDIEGDDAAAVDVTRPSEEAAAGLALSDGFESAAVGGPPDVALWSVVEQVCSGSGTLAVDDSQAHTGQHSLRVDGGAGYCDHVFVDNSSAISAVGEQVYARFFVRLSAPLGMGHVTFLAMKDASDAGGGPGDVRMGGQDMVLIYNRQSDDATLPVLSPTGVGDSVVLPADTWVCIEFHFDESAGTIDTWVNSSEVAGLVENGTPVPDISTEWLSQAGWRPTFSDFRLGWESYSGQSMTLWFDDVALAAHRIGCGT